MTQMNLSAKEKQTHRHREQTCRCQEGGERREGWIRIWRYKLLCIYRYRMDKQDHSMQHSDLYQISCDKPQ